MGLPAKRWFAWLLLSLFVSTGDASAEADFNCCTYPVLPKHAQSIDGLVPAGWRIEIQERGLLNGDRRTAVALVLRSANPAYLEKNGDNTNPRILAVAFVNADGSYELALQNHTLIPRPSADREFDYNLGDTVKGQEQKGLLFVRGALAVNINENFYAGPSASLLQTFVFRFRNGNFELIGYDRIGVAVYGAELIQSYNFLTRRKSSAHGEGCAGSIQSIKENCRFKTIWTELPPDPLMTIEDVGNSLEFAPEEE